jgi:hypothetical protein
MGQLDGMKPIELSYNSRHMKAPIAAASLLASLGAGAAGLHPKAQAAEKAANGV